MTGFLGPPSVEIPAFGSYGSGLEFAAASRALLSNESSPFRFSAFSKSPLIKSPDPFETSSNLLIKFFVISTLTSEKFALCPIGNAETLEVKLSFKVLSEDSATLSKTTFIYF